MSAGSSPRCSASRPTGTTRPPRRCSRRYGIHFDAALRDEIVARVDKLKLPSYTGFVQPKLEPVRDADGTIRDVTITYPQDLTTQMLEYSEATRSSREQFRVASTGSDG